jgi:hypothetical protein
MENCSCGGVVGCLIGVSGVLATATFAAVAASAVEAHHRCVRGSNAGSCSSVGGGRGVYSLRRHRSQERVVGGSVCFGGVGGSGGDNIYEFVFCGVVAE